MLAILFRVVHGCPIVVAANREEAYARSGSPPELWSGSPNFVAGRDPQAGGTWLGVNQHFLLVAVTNRPKINLPKSPRSRGLLCRDLLRCTSAREAHDRSIEALESGEYAGCNLLVMDPTAAYVVHAGNLLQSRPLPVGVHVVTASDLNDPADRRIRFTHQRLSQLPIGTLQGCLSELPRLCGLHGSEDAPPVCLHSHDRGTVSSSVISLGLSDGCTWLHAQGPPCQNTYTDRSELLRSILDRAGTRA